MTKYLFEDINIGAGFSYQYGVLDPFGAYKSDYIGIYDNDEHISVWTIWLGMPYLIPVKELHSFSNILYYIEKLQSKTWLTEYDVTLIGSVLFKKLNEKMKEKGFSQDCSI